MATKTIQPSSKDNSLLSNVPTVNYGTATSIYVKSLSGTTYRAIEEFTVAWGTDVPAGATITSAILYLYHHAHNTDPVGRTFNCYRVLRQDWNETQSTWNIYKTSNNWTTAGALSDGNDFTSTDVASAVIPAGYNWVQWDITNQVKTAQTGNFNVICLINDSSESGTDYGTNLYSREYTGDTAKCPKLIITYTADTVVTPGTASLTITSYAPVLKFGIIPPTASLNITTYAPTLKFGIIPGTASLVITTYAPDIIIAPVPPVGAGYSPSSTISIPYIPIRTKYPRREKKSVKGRAGIIAGLPATAPEMEIARQLNIMGIFYQFQTSFMGGRYVKGGSIADFYLPDRALIISVLGEYYHYELNRTASDKLQALANLTMGINTIFIDESDAMDNPKYYVEQALRGIDHSKLVRT